MQPESNAWKFSAGDAVRHLKTGNEYVILHHALVESDKSPVYVYRLRHAIIAEALGAHLIVWTRPKDEFEDGRFVDV